MTTPTDEQIAALVAEGHGARNRASPPNYLTDLCGMLANALQSLQEARKVDRAAMDEAVRIYEHEDDSSDETLAERCVAIMTPIYNALTPAPEQAETPLEKAPSPTPEMLGEVISEGHLEATPPDTADPVVTEEMWSAGRKPILHYTAQTPRKMMEEFDFPWWRPEDGQTKGDCAVQVWRAMLRAGNLQPVPADHVALPRDVVDTWLALYETVQNFIENGTTLTACDRGPCQRVVEDSDRTDPQSELYHAFDKVDLATIRQALGEAE